MAARRGARGRKETWDHGREGKTWSWTLKESCQSSCPCWVSVCAHVRGSAFPGCGLGLQRGFFPGMGLICWWRGWEGSGCHSSVLEVPVEVFWSP